VIRLQFPTYTPDEICQWVERFFKLWCRNQWKRERYAPSFHLDDENLDPKTWCRFRSFRRVRARVGRVALNYVALLGRG